MKAKVEVYFAMYLTAIISFFTVNELVDIWKNKAEEREQILIDVIKSLVEIGDYFEWTDVRLENSLLTGSIALNPSFQIREPIAAKMILKATQNPDDSLIITSLTLDPGTSSWSFSTAQLKPGVEYSLHMVTEENVNFMVSEQGRAMIKSKLLNMQSRQVTTRNLNLDSLATFISNNIQSVTSSRDFAYANPFILTAEQQAEAPRPEGPFIERTPVVIAGSRSNTVTFTYGNIPIADMRKAQVRIGSVNAELRTIDNNTATYALNGAFEEGTHQVMVNGIPDINTTNARLKAIRIDIECDDVLYESDDLSARINTRGESGADLRWRIERDGAMVKNGEGKGAAIRLAEVDKGRYTIRVFDDGGSVLAQRGLEVRIPPAPEVVEFRSDSARTVTAVVYIYGKHNIPKRVSGYVGTKNWPDTWSQGPTVDNRKEYRLTAQIGDSECGRSIIIALKVEDRNGQTGRERREKKTVPCR